MCMSCGYQAPRLPRPLREMPLDRHPSRREGIQRPRSRTSRCNLPHPVLSPSPFPSTPPPSIPSSNSPDSYWDWAAVSTLSPDITRDRVRVRRPKKTADEEIDNPLARYKFQTTPNRQLGSGEFGSWPQTLRWPNNRTVNARSQPEFYVNVLKETIETAQTNRDFDSSFPTRGKLVKYVYIPLWAMIGEQ